MQKIETISASQWAEIYKMRQSIYDLCASPTDRVLAEKAVEALYANAGRVKPKVIFCKSPLGGFLVLQALKKGANLKDNLWDNLVDNLRANLWENLRDNLKENLRDNLWENLRDNLRDNLKENLVDNLWDNLKDNLRANLWENLRANLWENLRDNPKENLWHNLVDNLRDNLKGNPWENLRYNLWDNLKEFYWAKTQLGFLKAGELAGIKYDSRKWKLYKLIVQNLEVILPFKDICIVCDRPIKIGWHDASGIHCEDGPAVEYADGYQLWALESYLVPEQVVMAPETQTIEDIYQEENEEIRRIRINRFGWSRYITEASGEILDVTMPQYGGMESLIKTTIGVVLCTYDPSTGRPYSLEVPSDIKTCEQAQRYLLAPDAAFGRHGVDVRKIETYPLIRA